MKNFFFSSFCLEKYKNNISIEINYGLFCYFKNSNFIMNQIAHSFYNNQGTMRLTQSSILVSSGFRGSSRWIPTASRIWTPTPTYSTSRRTRGSLLISH